MSLVFGVLSLGINFCYGLTVNQETMFDESLVSALAFFILIMTANMQNADLKLQREEVQENTNALIKQQKELEENNAQFKFFQTLNSINQIKYSLNINDEKNKIYISDYIDTGRNENNNDLSRFQDVIYVLTHLVKKNYYYYYNNESFFDEEVKKEYLKVLGSIKNNINRNCVNMYFLKSMIENNKLDTEKLEKNINLHLINTIDSILTNNDVKDDFYKLMNLHYFIIAITENTKDNNNSLRNLYLSTISKEEEDLYRFLNREVTIDDFYEAHKEKLEII